MTCDERRELLELYALGVLEQPERDDIDSHLGAGCPSCSSNLKRALATNAIVASSVPVVEPPKGLRKKVLASVGVEEKGGWWRVVVWSSAMAASLVAVLWLSVQDRRRAGELAQTRSELERMTQAARRSAASLERVEAAIAFLNAPETQVIGAGRTVALPPRARVFVNNTRGVLLLVTNLPPAPAGKIYEMWVIPKSGGPRPAGLFQSATDGNALHLDTGPIDVAAIGAVAVTVEPEGGSPQPTSQPFIVVSL